MNWALKQYDRSKAGEERMNKSLTIEPIGL